MVEPPTVIDLSKDDTNSHQANLRKLIAIDQEFAEDLAHQAKLWPDLKAERFASQDIVDLSTTLRTGKINLEVRLLRAFLVLWKDNLKHRQDMSSQQLIDLAVSLHGLVPRQLGPAEKQSSAANGPNTSKVNGVPERTYTDGYYIDHFGSRWPDYYHDVFHWEEGGGEDVEIIEEECVEDARHMWSDLDDKLIPKWIDLSYMATSIYHARINLEFRLLRPFKGRAMDIRDMVFAQMGPANMVTHNNGHITILREEGEEEDYSPEEDSDLDDEQRELREQASKHRLVTEVLYPRNRPTPVPETSLRKLRKKGFKRKRTPSSPSS